jgi:hypothetical protein
MIPEGEQYQETAEYNGTEKERLHMVKAVVAMANTTGGQLKIRKVNAERRHLESGPLHKLVNNYAGPPLHGLTILDGSDGSVIIEVDDSEFKPHIMKSDGRYDEGGEPRKSFHRGQIWVRHGARNAEATPDDLRQMIFDAAGHVLERVGRQIRQPGFVLTGENDDAIAVRLADDPDALLVRADPDRTYPHTRHSLSTEFDKPYLWITAAMKVLGIEDSPEYAYTDRNTAGHPTHWRYSDAGRAVLEAKITGEPNWDPRE